MRLGIRLYSIWVVGVVDRYGLLEEIENILLVKGFSMEHLVKLFRAVDICSMEFDFGNLWIRLLLDPPYMSPYEIRKDKTLRVAVECYGKDGEVQNIVHMNYSFKELENLLIKRKLQKHKDGSKRRKPQ